MVKIKELLRDYRKSQGLLKRRFRRDYKLWQTKPVRTEHG